MSKGETCAAVLVLAVLCWAMSLMNSCERYRECLESVKAVETCGKP